MSGSDEDNTSTLPDGYRWIRCEMQQISPTISIYCREKYIGDIEHILSELGDTFLNDFKKSCFGKLYNLPLNPIRNNQAIHYVLSREVSRFEGDATEMWFYVNDTLMRFSRFEFALVTGLRFGKSKFDPNTPHVLPSKSFYTRVLKNRPIKVIDLIERFKSNSLGQDGADYLKVAKVIFAYCVVFSYDVSKTNVADWMWLLVEDSKVFDSFPWGSYSYQILLHYLGKIKKKPSMGKREQYHLYGFATAFLAWIYCAIPRLGEVHGEMKSFDKIPRVLRFKFVRSNLEVENISGEIHPTLEPTDKERARSFWRSIEREGTPFELQFGRYQANKIIKKGKTNVQVDEEEVNDEGESEVEEIVRRRKKNSKKTHDIPHVEPRLKSKVAREEEEGEREEEDHGIDHRYDHHHSDYHHDYHFDDRWEPFQSTGGGGSSNGHHTYVLSSPQRRALVDDMMSRLESRYNDLKHDLISRFEPRLNDLMGRHNEMMSSFNDFIHRQGNGPRQPTPYQYWKIPENEKHNNQRAWMPRQDRFASQGQQCGGIRTHEGDTWHSSVLGSQWTNDYAPLSGSSDIHGLSQFRSHKTSVQQPLISRESSIVRFTMPDFRTIRQRKPSSELQSPFLNTDKRGTDYDAYIALGDKAPERNVGIGCAVTHKFFTSLKDVKSELDIQHLDAYLAILHTDPLYSRVPHNRTDIVLTSANFMHHIDRLWKQLHKDDSHSKVYDAIDEEILPSEELKDLSAYVTGDIPNWGERKQWWDFKKLVMIAHTLGHWITLQVNFETCSIMVYDSLKSKWTKASATTMKRKLIPLARILPQLLKYTLFYDLHRYLNKGHAKYTQWEIKFPHGDELFKQTDGTSCGLYALKYVESLLSGIISLKLSSSDLKNYRLHLAKTIYKFSTDGDTVRVPFDV